MIFFYIKNNKIISQLTTFFFSDITFHERKKLNILQNNSLTLIKIIIMIEMRMINDCA